MTDAALTPDTVRSVQIDSSTTSLDAIQRAAYRLSDRLSMEVRCELDTTECTLFVREGEDVDEVVAEFRNEVLDQVLRERIRLETEASRNLILALAFSKTGVVPED